METKLYDLNNLDEAAQALKKGEVVSFPTETVFGLGAMANNESAIHKVFKAKGRPSDNPLIVHVSSIEQVRLVASSIPTIALELMNEFWPGPLTIILPKGNIADIVTGGKSTVAVRMPKSQETLSLIDRAGYPLVGPSANISGKPSPTRVEHVLHDFNGKIAGVVSSSVNPEIGVESTVVYPHNNKISILRPGAITASMLKKLGYEVEELGVKQQLANPETLSPGVKYKHYSPHQTVYAVKFEADANYWLEQLSKFSSVGVIADDAIIDGLNRLGVFPQNYSLGKKGSVQEATSNLFAALRALDQSEVEVILVQSFDESDENAHAFMNRLSKAIETVI